MTQTVAYYCLIFIFCAIGLNFIRIAKGPSIADRAIAADAIFLNLVGLCALYSVFLKTPLYFDLVIVIRTSWFEGVF